MKKKTVQKKARRAGAAVRKTAEREGARVGAAAGSAAETAGEALRDTWQSTLHALSAAEQEVEKQIRQLLKRNRIQSRDAAGVLRELGSRADVERKKAMKDLQARLSTARTRIEKERKVVGHAVGEAVTGALASLNVPSRREIAELTKKVEQLGEKVDKFRARARRR
jgi:polyhydroxyalkanoate synthesis regulator phasin